MSLSSHRQFCQRCPNVCVVDFWSPLWDEVAGQWEDSILCIQCFAQIGDERGMEWELGIVFYPMSYWTHNKYREVEPVRLAEGSGDGS